MKKNWSPDKFLEKIRNVSLRLDLYLLPENHKSNFVKQSPKYRRSSGYDGLDLRCFEVTSAPHKNIKDNNTETIKLDYCDQELQ